MALAVGARLGPYDIIGPLGAGGMGEVYRARDTKLGREIALKILPGSFAADPDRLARFQREAQVLASLNHPNISAIYGLEESGPSGARALVLELVEGPTLADRIAQGAIPVDEALLIARQICDALEAAHEHGVIHRDLKPANIKLRPDGVVKVLDFGLAKLAEAPQDSRVPWSESPTLATMGTGVGVILGSAAYMAPEQAKGREADKRSDMWAFGCVLYEMLTRTQAFQGHAIAEVLASVIHTEPDWSAWPATVPGPVRHLVRRCLQKDPRKRLRDVADARLEIDEAIDGATAGEPAPTQAPAMRHRGWGSTIPWTVAAAMAVIAALVLWNSTRPRQVTARGPMRVVVALPSNTTMALSRGSSLAWSPDGRMLAYIAATGSHVQLYLRPVDREEATPVGGTDGAADPFFSPDGQWVGFFADGKLKKVSTSGTAPMTVADAPNPRGEAWGPDDAIYFTPRNNGGIWRVPSNGGSPQEVTKVGPGEFSHRWPQILPGGKAVLFTIWNDTGFEGGRVAVERLPAGERQILVPGGYSRYVGPDADGRGYLVYAQADGLLAAPFDPDRLALAGPAVRVLDNVITNLSGGAHVAFSPGGLLAYLPGTLGEAQRTLVWVDRRGVDQPVAELRGMSLTYRLSPDGRRLLRQNVLGTSRDLWIEELDRGTSTRFTFGGNNFPGSWSPDGKWIAYSAGFPTFNLFRKRADGTGIDERLSTGSNTQMTGPWSPDGRTLIFTENDPVTGADIWMLPMDGKPQPFLKTPFSEGNASMSPDGNWLAYQSNESGRFEIYVMAFPAGGRKWQVSADGGFGPIWARSGRELFYQTGRAMMVATVAPAAHEFNAERPRVLFEGRYEGTTNVAPDDQRFLLLKGLAQETSATQVNVIVNWFEELKRLMPTTR